jgi:hypothetical protein
MGCERPIGEEIEGHGKINLYIITTRKDSLKMQQKKQRMDVLRPSG